jgi:hypothetical protein
VESVSVGLQAGDRRVGVSDSRGILRGPLPFCEGYADLHADGSDCLDKAVEEKVQPWVLGCFFFHGSGARVITAKIL